MNDIKKLSKNYNVTKSYAINNLIENRLTIQELRLFSVYLSRINPKDINTRKVRFLLDDYLRLTGLSRLYPSDIVPSMKKLCTKTFTIIKDNEDIDVFTIFNKISYNKADKCIEITAHDDALPYLFELKKNFFSYKLWNILRLKTVNQLRMYEILKQYEKAGKREIDVIQLKELLGIPADKYPRIDNFKRKVLDKCQSALKDYTDIYFTYTKGKASAANKWETIIFEIFPNEPTAMLDFEIKLKEDINIEAAAADELRALEAVQDLPPEPESQSANDIRELLLKAAADDLTRGAAPELTPADELPEHKIQLDKIAYDMFMTADERLTETEILEIKCTLQCKGYEPEEIFMNFKRVYYRAINHCNDPAKLKEYIIKCIESEKKAS